MQARSDAERFFPATGFPPPKERHGQREGEVSLPAGTVIFSADDHISVGEDIWYDRFPQRLKDRAPRVWYADGVYHLGFDGKSLIRPDFVPPLRLIDEVPGASSTHFDLRMADLEAEGIAAELVFPNGAHALLHCADLEVRGLCVRVYNEYMAELQAKAPGRFYGVAMVNWWDAKGARATLAELKSLGLRTFFLPLKAPGADSRLIDWTSPAAEPVLDEFEESGLPISHHIGETIPRGHYNATNIGFLKNTGSFRAKFGDYVFGGILDRHPGLQIGWFEAGISWVASALQDAAHSLASYRSIQNLEVPHEPRYYWDNHMCASFIYDPLGLEMIDKIGADKVLWSSDYPHGESSIGHTRSFLKSVADSVDESLLPRIVGGNIMRFLGL